jgi:hypothetical protein
MKIVFLTAMVFSSVILSISFKQEFGGNPHGNIGFDCSLCHTTKGWKVLPDSMQFNHDKTGYPLIGGHKETGCRACHLNLVFYHIGTSCIDCHVDVHKGELGLNCELCHSQRTWENRQEIFESHSETRFPLTGIHAIVDCEACHYNQNPNEYKTTPLECVGCHYQDYNTTDNPNHIAAQFSTECESCHLITSNSWQQANYQHPSSFLLRGSHLEVACNNCHVSGFTGTPTLCEDCHIQDYYSTKDPDHTTFDFPTNCAICHNENHWQDAIFNHIESSGFELHGAHVSIQCTACHINNQTSGLPRDCIGCHDDDYNGVSEPNHVQGQFPDDCLLCHSEMVWTPATFEHNKTGFPLTGAHLLIDCSDCHGDGQYAGLPSDCFACHEADYNSTSDPNHIAAGFPVQCEECHNTNSWDQTTWNHDGQYFPIYSGKHREAWDNCTECHISPVDYKQFECIFCHEHNNQADLADKHKKYPEYTYQSSACYECHPRGESDDD